MTHTLRLAAAPALAVVITGAILSPARASTDALSPEAIGALAVAACQVDPTAPLALEDLAPQIVAESDVDVIPGEITAHLVRADVNVGGGEVQECTFGVLHRDALLSRVQYEGIVSLGLDDGTTVYSADTDVEIGNMGIGSAVDPTTEVALDGFLAPLDSVGTAPTYSISLERKAIEVVPIAVNRAQKDAAGKLLAKQVKAAAQLEKKQLKAAKAKHSGKAAAKAKAVYDRRVAAAQAAYDRATTPKTVARPVSHPYAVSGSITAG
jgi:hypothetical protein